METFPPALPLDPPPHPGLTPIASWLVIVAVLLLVVIYTTAVSWTLSRRRMPTVWLTGLVLGTLLAGGMVAMAFLPATATAQPAVTVPCQVQFPHCDRSVPVWLRP